MSAPRQVHCMVIGDPVTHSFSPAIHNAGYRAVGIDDRFQYIARRVKPDDIETFMRRVRASAIRGISCTMPHKQLIGPFLDEIDPIAQKIGAVNTVVKREGKLYGYNTDWFGTVGPLQKTIQLEGSKVAVIGAGGAARAMVYGLTRAGAKVTIYNRTMSKAQAIATEFGCIAAPLGTIAAVRDAAIICNATPVGMGKTSDLSPIDSRLISPGQVIFDAVYVPYTTTLLKTATKQGATVVRGTEMLLYQALPQFALFTGIEAPEDAMRQALRKAVRVLASE